MVETSAALEPCDGECVPVGNARRACIYAYFAGMTFGIGVMAFAWWLS